MSNPYIQHVEATSGPVSGLGLGGSAVMQLRTVDSTHALFFNAWTPSGTAWSVTIGVINMTLAPSVNVVGSPLVITQSLLGTGITWQAISEVEAGSPYAILFGNYADGTGFSYACHQLITFDTTTGAVSTVGLPYVFGSGGFGSIGHNPLAPDPHGGPTPLNASFLGAWFDATHFVYFTDLQDPSNFPHHDLWAVLVTVDLSTGVMTYEDESLVVASTVEDASPGQPPASIHFSSNNLFGVTLGGNIFLVTWAGGSTISGSLIADTTTATWIDVLDFGGLLLATGFDGVSFGTAPISSTTSFTEYTEPNIHGVGVAFFNLGQSAITPDGSRLMNINRTIAMAGDSHARMNHGIPLVSGGNIIPGIGRYVLGFNNGFILIGEELNTRFSEATLATPFSTAVNTGDVVSVNCTADHLDNYWRPIVSWSLDWGDGTIDTGSSTLVPDSPPLNRTHTYSVGGVFTATFIVEDSILEFSTPDHTTTYTVTAVSPTGGWVVGALAIA